MDFDWPLEIRLFGPFDVRVNGAPLARLRSRKGQHLVALLTLREGREVQRDWLAGTLWPDNDESLALYNLRRNLSDLRSALGAQASRLQAPTPHSLRLQLRGAFADVLAFDAALALRDTKGLEAAIALYRGPLMEGCTEEWVFQERVIRERAYIAALGAAAEAAIRNDRPDTAVHWLRLAVAAEPLDEGAACALMEALSKCGDYSGAAIAYRELRIRLRNEVHAEPAARTTELYQRLRSEARSLAKPLTEPAGRSVQHTAPAEHSLCVPLTGTVAFLSVDIENGPSLWQQNPGGMQTCIEAFARFFRDESESLRGVPVTTFGDVYCSAFATVSAALSAAISITRGGLEVSGALPGSTGENLAARTWPLPLSPRIAIHVGSVEMPREDYQSLALKEVAQLRGIGHGGQMILSEAAVELAAAELPEDAKLRDLGVHHLQDLQRPMRVFQLVHPSLPDEFPPLRSVSGSRSNLSPQTTSFVGRRKELGELKDLLRPVDHAADESLEESNPRRGSGDRAGKPRLVTLTGAGGCGKTRLALEVAGELSGAYANGVWLVELASTQGAHLVPRSVSSVLGIVEEPGRALIDTLVDNLTNRSLLLILDNCEHLVEACANLAATLLRRCPMLKILATSREPFSISGEMDWCVPCLSAPRIESLASPEMLMGYEAVQLFVERAASHSPRFALTPENAISVAQLCHRLDGIPLALELAAARVKVLSAEQIAARLGDRFSLLTAGSRDALPRHQTLRAMLDWSYALLSTDEQALLDALSVFTGGWSLEAAETVCSIDGISELETLNLLEQLLAKSLILFDAGTGLGRYRILETVRQYAEEHLRQSDRHDMLRRRHAEYYAGLVEEAEPHLLGRDQASWMARLETEHDNLRAAIAWCGERDDGAAMEMRIGGALRWFWEVRGHQDEGRIHLAAALSRRQNVGTTSGRAKALNGAGSLAWNQGDYDAARHYLEQALEIRRELRDSTGTANVLNNLGVLAWSQGDLAAARPLFEESVSIARGAEDRRAVAYAQSNLGLVLWSQGDYRSAQIVIDESMTTRREMGDQKGLAWALIHRTYLALSQGSYRLAQTYSEESLSLARLLGDTGGMADSLYCLGAVSLKTGDCTLAHSFFSQSLAIQRKTGDKRGIAYALMGLGCASNLRSDYARACSHFDESLALFRVLANRWGIGWVLAHRGAAARDQSDYNQALELCEQSHAIHREAGNMEGVAYSLNVLGDAAYGLHDPVLAESHLEAGLAIVRNLDNLEGVTRFLRSLGCLAAGDGDFGRAHRLHTESLTIARMLGDSLACARSLEAFAHLAAAAHEYERALHLIASASALREALSAPMLPAEREAFDHVAASVVHALGDECVATIRTDAACMTIDRAVAYAIGEPEGGRWPAGGRSYSPDPSISRLSSR